MDKTLVIMAAGMGSRYGGLKQVDPVGPGGSIIIDYSIYDAVKAGFNKVVFIIKKENEQIFREVVGDKVAKHVKVEYVFQSLDAIPDGFTVPEGRVKPWGTAHAILSCAGTVDGPFAVINADDFYGRGAFETIYRFLAADRPETEHAMVAYLLRNTVTEHGTVARGICQVENGLLTDVVERTKIAKRGEDAAYTEDGETWIPLSGESPVSMNFWGFGLDMLRQLRDRFPAWLDENLPKNPEKAEYFLPFVTNALIHEGQGTVQVLPCHESWHGITYKEDMPDVLQYIARLRQEGVYPETLLD